MGRPKTARELWGYIAYRFKVRLPWKVFTAGHSSPFAFVADAFFSTTSLLAWANRSGGKTLAGSIIAALAFRWPGGYTEGRILSGSADQASHMYHYWGNWCGTGGALADFVIGEPLVTRTRLRSGELAILTASQKSVRGPKIQFLARDEIDEMDAEVWTASSGMLASTPDVPAQTIDMSTWHRVDGQMAALVAKADDKGMTLHKWNIWESIDNCPPDRHMKGRGCDTCGLEFACRAKAREVHGKPDWPIGIAAEASAGLVQIDDAIKFQAKQWDRPTWDAEAECKRPSPKGLVYACFDPAVHIVKTAPPVLEIYRGIDPGWQHFACVWIGLDRANGTLYILDSYDAERATLAQHAAYLNKHELRHVSGTYVDPAGRNKNDQTGRSAIEDLAAHSIRCTFTMDKRYREVLTGIRIIRKHLQPTDGSSPKLFVVDTPNNRSGIINAFLSYRNRIVNKVTIDEPVKPQEADHLMDGLRYFFVNRMTAPGLIVKTLGAN